MFEHGFPKHWSTLKKLIWLVGSGIAGGASAVEKTVSGAIVHILDALAKPAISLKCEINHVQDLHGYDNPWPAGGGKNQFDIDDPLGWGGGPTGGEISTSGVVISFKIVGSGLTRYYHLQRLVGNQTVTFSGTSSKPQARAFVRLRKLDDSGWMTNSDVSINGFTYNSSYNGWYSDLGNNLQFSKKAVIPECLYWQAGVGYNNVQVTEGDTETISYFQIEAGSTATAWTPYSNLCPISGWTGLNLTRDGVNFFDKSILTEQATWRTVILSLPVGTVTMSTNKPDNNGLVLYLRKTGETGLSGINSVYSGHNVSVTLADGETAEVVFRQSSGSDSFANYNYQINLGTSALPYEEFKGETIPVSWQTEAGTVYGGSLDVITGVLTVTTVGILATGSSTVTLSNSWNKNPNGSAFDINVLLRPKSNASASQISFQISSRFKEGNHAIATSAANTFYMVYAAGSNPNCARVIWGKPLGGSSLEEFKAFLEDNPTQFVYEIETPIEYQLDPVTVNLLLGENNIWHDANGNIELTYYADGNASTSEALGILLGGAYHNPGGDDDATDEEALGILLGGN